MRNFQNQLGMLAILCVILSSCAQTGPPLPPSLELPKPPTDLIASRKGSRVTLSWSEPTLTTDRQSVRYLGSTRICRTLEVEMKECGFPVAQLAPPAKTGAGQPQVQTYTDTLSVEIQEQNATKEITYAIEVPNRDGRSAGLSNRVQVPAAPALPPPSNFAAQTTASGVELTWDGESDAPGVPEISHRYRVYRREAGGGKDVVVGEAPLQTAGPVRLMDQSFDWGKTYLYRAEVVTTVNLGLRPCANAAAQGADCAEVHEVEGDDTPEVRVAATDVFPPGVPAGLQAVFSGAGRQAFIDLIWAPVTDADLGGYNVYRREGNGAVVKLNAELVKSPSYRDPAVAAGKEYFYSVSSVDVRGNESGRSEEASESVPANP